MVVSVMNLPLNALLDKVVSAKTMEDVAETYEYIRVNCEIGNDIRSELIDSLMFRMMDIRKSA